jgi:L-fuculose-phosphate aldolase
MSSLDLTALRVIAAKDINDAVSRGAKEIITRKGAVITPLAADTVQRRALTVRQVDGPAASCFAAKDAKAAPPATSGSPAATPQALALFNSPEAERAKAEIVATGKKLWHRQYVDGNGGNISYRLGPNEVLCTPTLCSKFDLTPELISMVDLDGNQLAGSAARTSEIYLHLQIYKTVPEAKGVVHCHPPHATAYAITGRVPPSGIVPEFDVFVGAVALAPYETPGTQRFAETVMPFVKNYNTVLLGNHGIVCWADTVTHAEWYAEVLETYCWTLTIAASQLGVPVSRISPAKTQDLLNIKKRLGLPDPRLTPDACPLAEPEDPDSPFEGITLMPPKPCACALAGSGMCGKAAGGHEESDVDAVVRDVTEAVMAALQARGR